MPFELSIFVALLTNRASSVPSPSLIFHPTLAVWDCCMQKKCGIREQELWDDSDSELFLAVPLSGLQWASLALFARGKVLRARILTLSCYDQFWALPGSPWHWTSWLESKLSSVSSLFDRWHPLGAHVKETGFKCQQAILTLINSSNETKPIT